MKDTFGKDNRRVRGGINRGLGTIQYFTFRSILFHQ